jgi:large conductance mechanosensitive channel
VLLAKLCSVVNDVIMLLYFNDWGIHTQFISLRWRKYDNLEAAQGAGAAVITYGNPTYYQFVIIAFFCFVILRAKEKMK